MWTSSDTAQQSGSIEPLVFLFPVVERHYDEWLPEYWIEINFTKDTGELAGLDLVGERLFNL